MSISLTKNTNGTWEDLATTSIQLPPQTANGPIYNISVVQGAKIAIVGANGAGKSRMAGWIDQNNHSSFYIRARRNVVMPATYEIKSEIEELLLIQSGMRIGRENSHVSKNLRYRDENDAYYDDDFQAILNILGARHATSALQFKKNFDPKNPPLKPEESELDRATRIWSEVLPHLEIDAAIAPDLKVIHKNNPTIRYTPKDMSDGEKAIFYLVGKCMIAPRDAIIIVDEPEMYVHRSVRNKLWNYIENSRPDCSFIYMTHDLDFVRTRSYSKKFVVSGFSRKPKDHWIYKEFVADPEADEKLQISIYGSRQPTLLVEGDVDSLDFKIMSMIYPDFTIEPSGSCDRVISEVKSLRQQKKFHHQDVYGLVDRDFRSEEEIKTLRRKGISCIPFREIENALVSEDAITALMKILGHNKADASDRIANIVKTLTPKFRAISGKRANDLSKRKFINIIQEKIENYISTTAMDTGTISSELKLVNDDILAKIANVIEGGKWDDLLSIFSVRKDDFGSSISKSLDFKDFAAYKLMVLRISDQNNETGISLRSAIGRKFPRLG